MVLMAGLVLEPVFLPVQAQAGLFCTAEDFKAVCSDVLQNQNTQGPNAPPLDVSSECKLAELARKKRNVQQIKSITYTALTATLIGLIFAPGADPVCQGLSAAAALSDLALDQVFKNDAESAVGTMITSISGMAEMGYSGATLLKLLKGGGAASGGSAGAGIAGDSKTVASQQSANRSMGCALSAGISGVIAAKAWIELGIADQFLHKRTETARNLKLNHATVAATYVGTDAAPAGSIDGAVNAAATTQTRSANPCENLSGNAYLNCHADVSSDPQLSALISNGDFDRLLTKVSGKNLGDLVKGYKGNGSLGSIADYASRAMGLPAGASSAFGTLMDKAKDIAAKDLGDSSGGVYKPITKNDDTAPKSDDTDLSKLMGGLLKQLNPEAKVAPGENPAEAVYRKLDLLPKEQIETNRDISIFARVGYRYRKKSESLGESKRH